MFLERCGIFIQFHGRQHIDKVYLINPIMWALFVNDLLHCYIRYNIFNKCWYYYVCYQLSHDSVIFYCCINRRISLKTFGIQWLRGKMKREELPLSNRTFSHVMLYTSALHYPHITINIYINYTVDKNCTTNN